eukprot:3987170-Pleurochrysis_carterae.AAC.1
MARAVAAMICESRRVGRTCFLSRAGFIVAAAVAASCTAAFTTAAAAAAESAKLDAVGRGVPNLVPAVFSARLRGDIAGLIEAELQPPVHPLSVSYIATGAFFSLERQQIKPKSCQKLNGACCIPASNAYSRRISSGM